MHGQTELCLLDVSDFGQNQDAALGLNAYRTMGKYMTVVVICYCHHGNY